jgi:glycosyltransferase involved in cell wall biosynthesis
MSPRVSVIVPVHDVADTLERCVQSLLGQTLQDIEVVLVDDGSTDGSGAMCDAFGREDHRVVVIHQANGGLSEARNAGLSVARGEHIAFLDGDDWSEPDMLAVMADAAETVAADVVIAGCFVDVLDHEGRQVSSRVILPGSALLGPTSPPPTVTDDLVNLIGYAWNKLYRGELLRRASTEFTVGLTMVEDMVFNSEALTNASSVVLFDRAFVHYVQRPRPTLGTTFHPDLLELRLRAAGGLDAVFRRWSVEPSEAEAALTRLRVNALRSFAKQTSVRPELSLRRKAADFRAGRRGVDGLVRTGRVPWGLRLQLSALRHLPAVVVVVAFDARDRWRRPDASTSGGPG